MLLANTKTQVSSAERNSRPFFEPVVSRGLSPERRRYPMISIHELLMAFGRYKSIYLRGVCSNKIDKSHQILAVPVPTHHTPHFERVTHLIP
jgi:hypothetical protein